MKTLKKCQFLALVKNYKLFLGSLNFIEVGNLAVEFNAHSRATELNKELNKKFK